MTHRVNIATQQWVKVKHSGPELEDEQALALVRFAQKEGRNWKTTLEKLWMRAAASPELHRLRNTHGPAWLRSVKIET